MSTKIIKSIDEIKIKCSLCKGVLLIKDTHVLGERTFHADCYSLVLYRLDKFMDIVLLPQKEFDEWLEDDSQ